MQKYGTSLVTQTSVNITSTKSEPFIEEELIKLVSKYVTDAKRNNATSLESTEFTAVFSSGDDRSENGIK